MKRRKETPEGARLNARQYGLAFRDRPDMIAMRERHFRETLKLAKRQLGNMKNWQALCRADRAAGRRVGRGELWSATYQVRKLEREIVRLQAQLEGLLEGAAVPLRKES